MEFIAALNLFRAVHRGVGVLDCWRRPQIDPLSIVGPVAALIAAKIGIDIAFHLWTVRLYRQWVGDTSRASLGWALAAALVEPFTFQLLRHSGAALGWISFLTGSAGWGRQQRFGMGPPTAPANPSASRPSAVSGSARRR